MELILACGLGIVGLCNNGRGKHRNRIILFYHFKVYVSTWRWNLLLQFINTTCHLVMLSIFVEDHLQKLSFTEQYPSGNKDCFRCQIIVVACFWSIASISKSWICSMLLSVVFNGWWKWFELEKSAQDISISIQHDIGKFQVAGTTYGSLVDFSASRIWSSHLSRSLSCFKPVWYCGAFSCLFSCGVLQYQKKSWASLSLCVEQC